MRIAPCRLHFNLLDFQITSCILGGKQVLTIENIKDGLRAEAADLPERLSFMVVATERVGDVWTVELNPESGQADTGQRSVVLDEALEGARAWWAGPPKGKASVIAVIPEESKLFLSDIDTKEP